MVQLTFALASWWAGVVVARAYDRAIAGVRPYFLILARDYAYLKERYRKAVKAARLDVPDLYNEYKRSRTHLINFRRFHRVEIRAYRKMREHQQWRYRLGRFLPYERLPPEARPDLEEPYRARHCIR